MESARGCHIDSQYCQWKVQAVTLTLAISNPGCDEAVTVAAQASIFDIGACKDNITELFVYLASQYIYISGEQGAEFQ
jgi:hypothetical protein